MKQPLPQQTVSGVTTRRNFLKSTTGVAAGAAMLAELAPGARAVEASPLLPTIKLGTHDVTRLIIGGNPIYGYSHFNRVLSQAMVNWHTPDHVDELLREVSASGINTWQNSYAERTLSDLDRHLSLIHISEPTRLLSI